MLDVTISQILNEIDQTEYTLYTEWTEMSFKIMLLKSSVEPLMGEMLGNDISFYSKEHSKSCNEYLKETRDALSGKDSEIQYFLQDNKFEWRRNKKWILGKITVCYASNILVISETLYDLLKWQQHLQEVLSNLQNQNESLAEANRNIEEMIKVKDSMEKELYQKFILILNQKKDKIRELINILNNKENKKKTVFDACTDESEDSDVEQKREKTRSNAKKCIKKFMSNESTDQSEDTDMDDKQSFHIPSKKHKSINKRNFENEMEGIASTSKKMHGTTSRNVRPIVSSASSDESECELQLKLPEAYTNRSNIGNLKFEEELEKELFS